MSDDDVEEINKAQIEEMRKYRWSESEKAGHDLGSAAELDWISKYAEKFRDYWRSRKAQG